MTAKLSDLKPGERGIIREFRDNGILLKLMEMGCVPGESILMEQKAPLGDPVSVNIAGYHLSLRLDEAEQIIIDIIN
jgi:ferrous iron transport protein A